MEKNRRINSGELKSDIDGSPLDKPMQSQKGEKANMNQAEVDHIIPKSKKGPNESSNAQIISKKQNLNKSDKIE